MIGFYDYTVILTYLSLASAVTGCIVSLSGAGHPFMGMYFLLFCGLCDTFDGQVARSKPNRTEMEKAFGIQIDSLADLVAFGVLPACIGIGIAWTGIKYPNITLLKLEAAIGHYRLYTILFMAIVVFYTLAALIRLAYFNVLAEEKLTTGKGQPGYIGLPVTAAALIFPMICLFQFLSPRDHTLTYFAGLLVVGILFLCKFRIPKPGKREIAIMLGIGMIEFIIALVLRFVLPPR